MPTGAEYAVRLGAVSRPFTDMPFKNKFEIRHILSLAAQAVRAEGRKCTAEITARWKEEFARIKKENDDWQRALATALKNEIQMVWEREGDMEEGLQK